VDSLRAPAGRNIDNLRFVASVLAARGPALKLETTGLIDLHALVSRMRIVSSQPVIESAIKVVKAITDTYNQPNKTPEEIEAMISDGSVDGTA